MIFLLDTHILIWAAGDIDLLSTGVRLLIEDTSNELLFSPASIWETAIKHSLGRDDFRTDPFVLRYRLSKMATLSFPLIANTQLRLRVCLCFTKTPSIAS